MTTSTISSTPHAMATARIKVDGYNKCNRGNTHCIHLADLVKSIQYLFNIFDAEDLQKALKEMYRVLKPGGIAAIFEHNPANPVTRKVVKNCKFDRDAALLPHKKIFELFTRAGFEIIDDAYIIFFPFKSGLFRRAEKMLKWFPLGAQQYVTGRKT